MIIKSLNCLGIMGASTFGGVELALIKTDGIDISDRIKSYVVPYPEHIKSKICSVLGMMKDSDESVEKLHEVDLLVSDFYISLINDFKKECDEPIDLIGLEGITIVHNPYIPYTYQLGIGRYIAKQCGIKTVTHFRNADICNGGIDRKSVV